MRITGSEPHTLKSVPHRKSRRLKAVAVIPALLTLGNLLCGFTAIYFCMRVAFGVGAAIDPQAVRTLNSELLERLLPSFLAISAWCILIGLIFDGLDGRVARLSNQTSKFGEQLDSLADVVTFGVAPAILVIAMLTSASRQWETTLLAEDTIGRGRWMMVAVFVACAAIRLARFNVETTAEASAHRGFKGLPSPAAAGTIASLVALHEWLLLTKQLHETAGAAMLARGIVLAMPWLAVALALLMVSRLDYTHVVSVYLSGRRPIGHIVIALALIIFLVQYTEITGAIGFTLYALTGPVRGLVRLFRGPRQHKHPAAAEPKPETDAKSQSSQTA